MYKWTKEKLKILEDIYPTGNIQSLIELLFPIKERTIRHKAAELGLRVTKTLSNEDITFILSNYQTMSYSKMAIILNKKEEAIREKAIKLGLRKHFDWSEDEISIIKEIYPATGAKYIKENYLPYRSEVSIINMATKLGVVRINKNEKYFDKNQILFDLKNVAEKISRTPKTKDLIALGLPSAKTFQRYFGSYSIACEMVGLPINSDTFGRATVCYSINGDRCLSGAEKEITDFFIKENIPYQKEVPYKQYIPEKISGGRIVDWVIFGDIFVEYFGLDEKPYYKKRMIQKINMCNQYKVKLIELYRKDLRNLHSIFQILL